MPTRLLRSNTIANIADFGAQSPGIAALNAQAFSAALHASTRVAVPAGVWNISEIIHDVDPWLPFNVEIFGEGPTQSVLHYEPVDPTIPLFSFFPGPARSTIRDLAMQGPVVPCLNTPPIGIGIDFGHAWWCRVRDVILWNFDVGVDFGDGSLPYSGYNTLERFEVNRCRTGIRARDLTNGNTIQNGRIWHALYQEGVWDRTPAEAGQPCPGETSHVTVTAESGIGLDIEGTTDTFGPLGAPGLLVQGVQIESAVTCVRVVNSRQTTISGGYFEPGEAPDALPRRRVYEVSGSTGLVMQGNYQSEPGGKLGEETWTPSYFDAPPEDTSDFSGTSIQSASDLGTFVTGHGAARSGATAPHVNRILNADMSRGAMGWSSSGAIIVTTGRTPFVTGGASLGLQVATAPTEHIAQSITVDTGVRSVTVGVRYQFVSDGPHAFRIELYDLDGLFRLAHHTDVESEPGVWQVRTLTGRFDQLASGVVGPRHIQVRLYPYNAGPAPAAQEVLVDSVWLVDGEYGPPFRHYTEGHELLRADERETFFSGSTSVDIGPIPQLPSRVPANAIGMVVEIQVEGTRAGTHRTGLRVDDGEGSSSSRDVFAFVDGLPVLVEYTLPLTPGSPPNWSVQATDPTNTVYYAVRLKRWITRL